MSYPPVLSIPVAAPEQVPAPEPGDGVRIAVDPATGGVFAKRRDGGADMFAANVRGVLDATFGGTASDVNSVITGDVQMPEYRNSVADSPPYAEFHLYPNQALTQSSAYQAAHQLNPLGAASGQGRFSVLFYVPFAATWSFNVPAAVPSGTSTIKLVLYATDQATPVASQVFTVTTTEQTFSLGFAYAPGFQYMAEIQVNDTGQQAKPYIGRVTLTPSAFAGTGVFGAAWKRIRIHGGMLAGSAAIGQWSLGQFFDHTPHADLSFLTDATTFAVESYQVSSDGLTGCLVDGLELPQLSAMAGKIVSQVRTLPASLPRAVRNITVRSGMAGGLSAGTMLRAIYVPASAAVIFPPTTATRRLCIVGDSVTNGSVATIPIYQGWVARLKKRYAGTTIVDAYPGRGLFHDAQTAAIQKASALRLAQLHLSDLIIALGTNDYNNGGLWSAASFGTAYGAFLDFFHGMSPATRVWCQSSILKNGEGANSFGSTLGDYRTQVQTVATNASRAPWCNFVDGTGATGLSAGLWPVLGDLPDNLHPNNTGHGKIGQAWIVEMHAQAALG